MGELGIDKILLILGAALLLFGAKRIPEIAGSFGKGIREFKRNMNEIGAPEPPPAALPPQQSRQTDESRPEPKRLV
ncbi:MAG TPA: twin-arginine translocase TatA/TatE family subunit [Gemmatimonadaceae bacterium]|jgi:sec-independent protein translocase protein TatA|nr:twin-arginine translocase TatA/TatE family subunit [Gemmatimonadaceae bacterium]HVP70708.1 twin-arginine translocase TatA/TatE family subunit [Gemmatimonadaceae bacterium]